MVITEIAIIYYYKTHSNRFIEYVAVDENTFNLSNLLISIFRLWITKGYLIIVIPAVILIFFVKREYNSYKKEIPAFFLPLALLFVIITLPQILLYSKSLIFERYLLPGTLGSAIAILFLQKFINQHQTALKFLDKIFLPACTLLLFLQIILMTKGAVNYANTGYEVKKCWRLLCSIQNQLMQS
ncbi:MAG: hypothetical protein WKF59_02875 [Chitinophagaceae bacterium]